MLWRAMRGVACCFIALWNKTRPQPKRQCPIVMKSDLPLQNHLSSHTALNRSFDFNEKLILLPLRRHTTVKSNVCLLIVSVVVLPQLATTYHAVTLSVLTPHLGLGRRIRGKKGKKLLGWDEKSLSERQREKKTTISNTDKKQMQQCSACSWVAKTSPSASSPLKYWAWQHVV